MTEKQAKYLEMYESGMTMDEIAKVCGKNKSTISRMIKMAERNSNVTLFDKRVGRNRGVTPR